MTSLYPYVMKDKRYPSGHPCVLRGHPSTFKRYSNGGYFGVIFCRVLPPRRLYIPTLPARIKGSGGAEKLVFALCRTCAELQQYEECKHTDEQRSFEGCWCTPEVDKAVEDGYQVTEIYEVWQYTTSTTTLFQKFVNLFYKLKTEASGWPEGIESEKAKKRFIRLFKEREGIDLDPEKMEYNPGRRVCCKTLLNSLWGFLCRKLGGSESKIFHNADEFFQFVDDDTLEEKFFMLINECTVFTKGKKKEESIYPDTKGNIVISCFVTMYARLHLLDLLRSVGERALYADTDSVFYTVDTDLGEKELAKGPFLGELTDVFPNGHVGVKFAAGGPKNYGCSHCLPKDVEDPSRIHTCFKVRGVTSNVHSKDVVNFDTLCRFVLQSFEDKAICTEKVDVDVFNINRNVKNMPFELAVETLKKSYSLVFDKRKICWDSDTYKTLPFGY